MNRGVQDHSRGAFQVDVACCSPTCKRSTPRLCLGNAIMDPDGRPFHAYYHADCVPEGVEILPCPDSGCFICAKLRST